MEKFPTPFVDVQGIYPYPQGMEDFLKRIAPTFAGRKFEVPLKEWDSDERLRRRVSHRNERFIYKTKSAVDGKPILSIYSPQTPYKIFPVEDWFGDGWDAMDYGRDFDFGRSFNEQFGELQVDVPRANMMTQNNENSDYTTGTGYCKNCYLINSSENCEDCYYGKLFQKCKDCVDCSYVYDSELLYGCFNVRDCYSCKFLFNSSNCSDCAFSDNLSGCRDCFLCTNLNGKQYYFKNERCESKEDYEAKIAEFVGWSGFGKAFGILDAMRAERIYKYSELVNCEKCTGDFLKNNKNCVNCYDVVDSEDCENLYVGVKCKDVVDSCNMYLGPELSYQMVGTINTFNVHFGLYQFDCSNTWYSDSCYGCKDCFGCVGLRNKQYCVFNKQYSKEEYEELVARIIDHMISGDEWGRFFDPQISPFGYNETLANEYLPLSKEEALERGFKWNDYQAEAASGGESLKARELPDKIEDVVDEILESVIECAVSEKPFRILREELMFYRKMNVPLPRLHPDLRYDQRIRMRKMRKLWDRKCDKCEADLKSVFEPGGSETIYCEECYGQEIY